MQMPRPCKPGHRGLLAIDQAVHAKAIVGLISDRVGELYQPCEQHRIIRRRNVGQGLPPKVGQPQEHLTLQAEQRAVDCEAVVLGALANGRDRFYPSGLFDIRGTWGSQELADLRAAESFQYAGERSCRALDQPGVIVFIQAVRLRGQFFKVRGA
jgi:hypothetical protein